MIFFNNRIKVITDLEEYLSIDKKFNYALLINGNYYYIGFRDYWKGWPNPNGMIYFYRNKHFLAFTMVNNNYKEIANKYVELLKKEIEKVGK